MAREASWRRELDRIWFSPQGTRVREAVGAAAGLLSPSWCVGCGAEDSDLCEECSDDLRLLTRDPFRAEGRAPALPVVGAAEEELHVLPVIAAGHYGTLLSRAVVGYKDHERIRLDRVLAPALGRAAHAALERLGPGPEESAGEEPVLLIPPPASLSGRTRRSHDPVGHLLERLSDGGGSGAGRSESGRFGDRRSPGAEIARGLLVQRPKSAVASLLPGSAQKGHGLDGRRRRLGGEFRVTGRGERILPGRKVLLVDDVLTTGVTLHALHRVLTGAGAEVLGACVLAAAEVRRGGDSSQGSGLE